MDTGRILLAVWFCAVLIGVVPVALASDQPVACIRCHSDLTEKKYVHDPVKRCTFCHRDLDARGRPPHKSTGRFPMGLRAEGARLCMMCHEKDLFEGKYVHAPVAAGQCLACHDEHSSDYVGLARKQPAEQCLDCHTDVKQRPHVIVGFGGGGHPLGDAKEEVADPLREGKPFYCASCHEPHRSTLPALMRFEPGTAACQSCHKK